MDENPMGRIEQIEVVTEYEESYDPGDWWTPPTYDFTRYEHKVERVHLWDPEHPERDEYDRLEIEEPGEPEWEMAEAYIKSDKGRKECDEEFNRTI